MVSSAAMYGLLSITKSCVNRGNLIIEHAARRVLGLDATDASPLVLDAHSPLSDEDAAAASSCRATVLPGATLLQPGDHLSVERLDRITSPLLAIGSALRSMNGAVDLSVAQSIGTVIGSRDPFTHDALTWAGIPSRLVGCPTLLLADAEAWRPREGPIVFAAGLGDQATLAAAARACAEVGPTVLLLHAPERQPPLCEGPDVRAEPLDSAEQAFALVRSASVVVTSRMHAFLSALIHGVPAIFLGGFYDSRYTMLEYLGVPIEPPVPQRIKKLLDAVGRGKLPSDVCFERARTLRAGMRAWVDEVGGPVGLRIPADLPKPA
jgi:hypothetical protein